VSYVTNSTTSSNVAPAAISTRTGHRSIRHRPLYSLLPGALPPSLMSCRRRRPARLPDTALDVISDDDRKPAPDTESSRLPSSGQNIVFSLAGCSDRLPGIPVLDNLAVAQPEEVEASEAAIIWPRGDVIVDDDKVAIGDDRLMSAAGRVLL